LIVPKFISCTTTGYFFIYSFNPGFLSRGNSLVLWIEGGVSPFNWNVTGSHFSLLFDEDEQYAIITCDSTVSQDTTETVTITDSCGTVVSGTVCACDADNTPCCDTPTPILYDSDNPEIFVVGEQLPIWISGGCPPYKWETLPANASDYHFERTYTNDGLNFLHALKANKAFSVRITDNCGTQFGPSEFSSGNANLIVEDLDEVGGFRWFALIPGCFGSYSPPNWSPSNATEIAADECDYFTLVNGLPPFIYWPEGEGYLPTSEGTALVLITSARIITVCAEEDAESYIGYGVMDICGNTALGETDIWTCCDEGKHTDLSFDDNNTADTIVRNSSIQITMKDGCGPYTWTVSGTGFTIATSLSTILTNTLNANGVACGPATVTCTDTCGHTATAKIRCTAGSWVTTAFDVSGTCYWQQNIVGNRRYTISTNDGHPAHSSCAAACADPWGIHTMYLSLMSLVPTANQLECLCGVYGDNPNECRWWVVGHNWSHCGNCYKIEEWRC
jgi:hypothetical protein